MATYTDVEIRVKITNGICNIATGRYPLNTPLHIELTPSTGIYGITGATKPYLKWFYTGGGSAAAFSQVFTKSDTHPDKWVLNTEMAYYQASSNDMYCTITYTYNKKYSEVKSNLTHCIASLPDGYYPYEEQNITVTADAGFEFQLEPTISYYVLDKSQIPNKYVYTDFTMNRVSESEYNYTFIPDSHNAKYTVNAVAVAKTDVTDKYGLIALYKPSKDILVELSHVRFASPKLDKVEVDGTVLYVGTDEYIDTAKYMISLRKMYFKINTTIEENICLGPYNTKIMCPVIGTDIVTMDMGSIAIAGRHQNNMDYKNTEMQMYLPFIGFVDLSPSDYMDKEISLKYEINLVDGDALAVLYAEGNVMQTYACNVSYPVPYRLNFRDNVDTELKPNTNYLLSEKPFVYVKSYNATAPDATLPYKDTKFYSKFSDVHGYTEATEIDFEVVHDFITKTEIDEIIDLLKSGVFFQ